MLSGSEGEVSFSNWNLVGVVGKGGEVALLDIGELAADVTGVDSDVDLV